MTEPHQKLARVEGSGVEADTLSLEAVVCRLVGGFVGVSGSVSLSFQIRRDPDPWGAAAGEPYLGWELKKIWDVGAAPPRIEIGTVAGADWDLVTALNPNPRIIYRIVQALRCTPTNSAWAARWIVDYMEKELEEGGSIYATLCVFGLPETHMELDKSTEGKLRLRSMARIWELVSEAAVVAST